MGAGIAHAFLVAGTTATVIATSPAIVSAAQGSVSGLGKTAITVKGSPGSPRPGWAW